MDLPESNEVRLLAFTRACGGTPNRTISIFIDIGQMSSGSRVSRTVPDPLIYEGMTFPDLKPMKIGRFPCVRAWDLTPNSGLAQASNLVGNRQGGIRHFSPPAFICPKTPSKKKTDDKSSYSPLAREGIGGSPHQGPRTAIVRTLHKMCCHGGSAGVRLLLPGSKSHFGSELGLLWTYVNKYRDCTRHLASLAC